MKYINPIVLTFMVQQMGNKFFPENYESKLFHQLKAAVVSPNTCQTSNDWHVKLGHINDVKLLNVTNVSIY